MKIVGTEGLTNAQIQLEVQQGAKFVIYQYCVSLVVITLKRPSNIYYIRPGASSVGKGVAFSVISFLFGWWGIPWGPIYTIQSLWRNFSGGRDVTREVFTPSAASQPVPQARGARASA